MIGNRPAAYANHANREWEYRGPYRRAILEVYFFHQFGSVFPFISRSQLMTGERPLQPVSQFEVKSLGNRKVNDLVLHSS